ncbi:MAG: antitoxin [Bacteroidetes bacterium GWA2_32_17]|nr:MAG: antitoxin [Bacteroidetes bacterium GWA2_32_17]
MDNEIRTWLFDVLQSITEIEGYFTDKPRKFEDYSKDIRTKRAVERNIKIIGEAINRILIKDINFEIENAQKIIGTRNRIAHGYDKISDDLIWSIVINHLPKLKAEISLMLVK